MMHMLKLINRSLTPEKGRRGFTIVELLIAIVVIAILAAISVTAYVGIQGRAHDAAIQNDLRTFKDVLTMADTLDRLAGSNTPDALDSLNWKASKGSYMTDTVASNLFFCRVMSSDYKRWALIALSRSGNIYYTSQSVGPTLWPTLSRPSFDTTACDPLAEITGDPYSTNWRGYARDDSTTGPWRAWTGKHI